MWLGVALLLSGALTAQASAAEAPLATIPVTIETANGTRVIQAEVACKLEDRMRGLMGRESLAPDSGMIFFLPKPRPMRMWMKDTPLALDLVFFDKDRKIILLARNATPNSEAIVESGGAVIGVLEIAGGRATEIGISPGDRLLYSYPQGTCE